MTRPLLVLTALQLLGTPGCLSFLVAAAAGGDRTTVEGRVERAWLVEEPGRDRLVVGSVDHGTHEATGIGCGDGIGPVWSGLAAWRLEPRGEEEPDQPLPLLPNVQPGEGGPPLGGRPIGVVGGTAVVIDGEARGLEREVDTRTPALQALWILTIPVDVVLLPLELLGLGLVVLFD